MEEIINNTILELKQLIEQGKFEATEVKKIMVQIPHDLIYTTFIKMLNEFSTKQLKLCWDCISSGLQDFDIQDKIVNKGRNQEFIDYILEGVLQKWNKFQPQQQINYIKDNLEKYDMMLDFNIKLLENTSEEVKKQLLNQMLNEKNPNTWILWEYDISETLQLVFFERFIELSKQSEDFDSAYIFLSAGKQVQEKYFISFLHTLNYDSSKLLKIAKGFSKLKLKPKEIQELILKEYPEKQLDDGTLLQAMIDNKDLITLFIWKDMPEEVQLTYYEKIMEMYENKDIKEYIFLNLPEELQKEKLAQFIQIMNYDTEQVAKLIKSNKINVTREDWIKCISILYQGNQLNEIINIWLGEAKILDINLKEAQLLKGKISAETSIVLEIKNAAELSSDKLDELQQVFNIKGIKFKDINLSGWQTQNYDIETYKKCRNAIDTLLDGVDKGNVDDPNREKKIFGEVIKRLAEYMCYDIETYMKGELRTRTAEEYIISANMIGGLLNKKCVCAGYAEIVRNVFACCGIDAILIGGSSDKSGHAWNQIKLDGIWYNMDLTWDRDKIVEGEIPLFLLKSDKDFLEHDVYDTSICKKEICPETVLNIMEYIGGETPPLPGAMLEDVYSRRSGEIGGTLVAPNEKKGVER